MRGALLFATDQSLDHIGSVSRITSMLEWASSETFLLPMT
jgi:hypothetical protein